MKSVEYIFDRQQMFLSPIRQSFLRKKNVGNRNRYRRVKHSRENSNYDNNKKQTTCL